MYFEERSNILITQSRFSELLKLCQNELNDNPLYSRALVYLGYSKIMVGDKSGIEEIKAGIAQEPEESYYYYLFSLALEKLKDRARALSQIELACKLLPDCSEYYFTQARFYCNDKFYKLAMEKTNQAFELTPTSGKIAALKALIYLRIKDRKKAMEWVENALRLDPNDTFVQQIASVVQVRSWKFKSARDLASGSLHSSPNNSYGKYLYLHTHVGWFMKLLFNRLFFICASIGVMFGVMFLMANVGMPNSNGKLGLMYANNILAGTYFGFSYILAFVVHELLVIPFADRKIRLTVRHPKAIYLYSVLIVLNVLFGIYAILDSRPVLVITQVIFFNVVLMTIGMIFYKKIPVQIRILLVLYNVVFLFLPVIFGVEFGLVVIGGVSIITMIVVLKVYVYLLRWVVGYLFGLKDKHSEVSYE